MVSDREDLALVDLEQHYWPYLWPSTWKPWILFVHVVLTLEPVSPNSSGQPSQELFKLCLHVHCLMHQIPSISHLFT